MVSMDHLAVPSPMKGTYGRVDVATLGNVLLELLVLNAGSSSLSAL